MAFDEEKRAKYKIDADVVDREEGVRSYEEIKMIRLVSKDHNLLIMEDFMPVIGELEGLVEFVYDNSVVTIKDVHGFYMHKHNHFTLVIENTLGDSEEKPEGEEA